MNKITIIKKVSVFIPIIGVFLYPFYLITDNRNFNGEYNPTIYFSSALFQGIIFGGGLYILIFGK